MLLGSVSCLIDLLCAFYSPRVQFLRLVLDLVVESLKNRKDRAFDILFGFETGIDKALLIVNTGVGPHAGKEFT